MPAGYYLYVSKKCGAAPPLSPVSKPGLPSRPAVRNLAKQHTCAAPRSGLPPGRPRSSPGKDEEKTDCQLPAMMRPETDSPQLNQTLRTCRKTRSFIIPGFFPVFSELSPGFYQARKGFEGLNRYFSERSESLAAPHIFIVSISSAPSFSV